MKILRIAILFLTASYSAAAQGFEVVGPPLLVQEVQFDQANECFIYFDDGSPNSLRLRWQLEEVSIPEGWDIDLCDYGACYTGIPQAATMLDAPGLDQPYIKLIVQPGAISGSAWLWFRVSLYGQPDFYRDVYFSLYTPGVTAASEPDADQSVTVFPNPATDFFTIIRNSDLPQPARLMNVSGKTVWAGILKSTQTLVSLPDLNAGIYFLETAQIRKTVIIH